jgi:hypothetical protein
MKPYDIPRHWEFDRLCTWDEVFGRHGLLCMDCDAEITDFSEIGTRLTEESAEEISFSDADVIPVVELICLKCAGA